MAINDWLAPQPTYLTSRAMGAVVPEYFQQAADVAKTRLGLLGQEQGLRIADEQAARAREEDARMKASREAAASLLPRITQLDPTSPDYYSQLYGELQTPGAANALTDRSMSEFLGLQQRARGEQIDQSRLQQQMEREDKRQTEMLDREERAAARSSAAALTGLIDRFGMELDDPAFPLKYRPQLKEFDKMSEDARDAFMDNLNLDYSQARMRNAIANTGMELDSPEVQKLMIDDGSGKKVFSRDKVNSFLGRIRRDEEERRFQMQLQRLRQAAGPFGEELPPEVTGKGIARDTLGAGGSGKRTSVE